jgi:hypothetical protein
MVSSIVVNSYLNCYCWSRDVAGEVEVGVFVHLNEIDWICLNGIRSEASSCWVGTMIEIVMLIVDVIGVVMVAEVGSKNVELIHYNFVGVVDALLEDLVLLLLMVFGDWTCFNSSFFLLLFRIHLEGTSFFLSIQLISNIKCN